VCRQVVGTVRPEGTVVPLINVKVIEGVFTDAQKAAANKITSVLTAVPVSPNPEA
jgi:hypothetical protein